MQYDLALTTIARKLNLLGVKWRLFASGALYVWGVDIIPKDIDIFVSKTDIQQLEKELIDNIVNPLHQFVEEGNKYLEFQLNISGIEVEICELDNFGKTVPVTFRGETIWVVPLQEERDEYFQNSPFKDRLPQIDARLKQLTKYPPSS
jgi:hypothetical protein